MEVEGRGQRDKNGAEVHRLLDHQRILWKIQLLPIHRSAEDFYSAAEEISDEGWQRGGQ